jgi:hypothetical protein
MTTRPRISRIRLACGLASLSLTLGARPLLAEGQHDRFTVGTDPVATLGTAAIPRALWLAVALEAPLPRLPLTLELEPSVYWTKASGESVFQATLAVKPRLYLNALLDGRDALHRISGLYATVGPAFAYARASGGEKSLSVLAVGPVAQAGYRYRFESAPLYIEPYAGWMALYGRHARGDSDASYDWTQGLLGGCMVGGRF